VPGSALPLGVLRWAPPLLVPTIATVALRRGLTLDVQATPAHASICPGHPHARVHGPPTLLRVMAAGAGVVTGTSAGWGRVIGG